MDEQVSAADDDISLAAPLDAALRRLRAARAPSGLESLAGRAGAAADDDAADDDAADADAAWRAVLAGDAAPAEAWVPVGGVELDPDVLSARSGSPADGFAEPGGRLRDRMGDRRAAGAAARHVAAAYAAAQGHVSHDAQVGQLDQPRRRWSVGPRAAVVGLAAILAIGMGVAAVSWPRGDVRPVAELGSADAPGGGRDADGGGESGGEDAAGTGKAAGSLAAIATAGPNASAVPSPGGVVVHVVGQVTRPGLVTLPAGARVADAVAAAGGATDRADLAAVNLARPVVDGEQLRVPAPGEPAPPAEPARAGSGDASTGGGAGGLVDLNTADEAALDALPGIGPALAGRIVAWRDEHGGFASVDELDEVSGIGPAVLEQVRDLVRV